MKTEHLSNSNNERRDVKSFIIKNGVTVTRRLALLVIALLSFILESKADYTIASGSSVSASTITSQSGTLTINGTLLVNSNVSLTNFTTVIINGPNGQIYWSNNSDLTFSASVAIIINSGGLGLQPTGGNASKRLIIGTTTIAVSNDNSNNAAFSFEEFNMAGGLPQFIMSTSVSSICSGSSFTATITPLNSTIYYDCVWSISAAGTKSPGTHNNFNSAQTTTITPSGSGSYTVSCALYRTGDDDPIITKTKSVTVYAVPSVPTAVTATPAAICLGASSNIKATSSSNTIQWYNVSTGGTSIGSSASAANYPVSPAATTTYYAEAKNANGCVSSSRVSTTVTVSPVSAGGTVSGDNTVCAGSNSSTLTLSGYTGSITRWESSTDNFATAATTISNTTSNLAVSNLSTTTYYRAVVTSGACAAANSPVAALTVSNPGTWLGVNTDWNSSLNWCNGSIPTASTNVVIPNGLSFYPVITGTASANNVTVAAGGSASVTVTGTLKIAGSVTASAGINAAAGTIEYTGSAAQTIRADQFVSGIFANVKISNTLAGASAVNPSVAINAAGGMVKISGTVSFGAVNNAYLQTNDNLALLSTAAATAAVADITNNNVNTGNAITGKVVIERYIPGKRAWRLLSAPVKASSNVKISDAWQEGAARVTNPAAINTANNPNPGYGTHITYGSPAGNGYDQGPNGNTNICYLTPSGWNGVPTATNNGATANSGYITDQQGYMLFVRGDRSTPLSSGTGAAVTSTILRMKGTINTGQADVAFGNGYASGPSKFRVVGNPYPSAVNFHKIVANSANTAAGFSDAFYLWDPAITGTNGVGGWVAMSYNNLTGLYDRNVVSGGTSSINNTGDIQSGAAFLIDYPGTATSIQLKESNKVSGSNNSQFRPSATKVNQLRVSLFAKNTDNTVSVNDGLLVSFNDAYSNNVDRDDMKKVSNFAENFGVTSKGELLSIERRNALQQTDTIAFKMTKMKQKKYQIQVDLNDLDAPEGTTAILEDKFLHSKTVLDIQATGLYDFAITNAAASSDTARFRLLFKRAAEFTGVSAAIEKTDAIVKWSLPDEFNLSHYEIERSTDGTAFSKLTSITVGAATADPALYNWTDKALAPGDYFYRIKAVSNNGVVVYSNKVSVTMLNNRKGMYVFPNPVTGNQIQLHMGGIPAGKYKAKVSAISGEQITAATVQYNGSSAVKVISLPAQTANGMYLLQVSDESGKTTSIKLLVQKN